MLQNSPKNSPNLFECEPCDYKCSKKSDMDKHLLTNKHKCYKNGYKSDTKLANGDMMCNVCEKVYKSRMGLWRHKKTCGIQKKEELLDKNEQLNIDTSPSEVKVLTNLILEMVKSNSELQKQNSELQKQVLDVCKNSNINSNNMTINNSNNNSNNKTFNLQFFLNEQCKDAMNISEFVNSFDLRMDDLESVGALGYVEGITKQFLDKLNGMDIYKRPMHCSDAKRETIYIKDENKWEKEERGTPKLRKAIKTVSFNNLKLLVKWTDTYPESKNIESRLNDKYLKLVKQTTGGNGELSDNEDKIIKRIAKEIIIEKS
jgi:hypothetical protein